MKAERPDDEPQLDLGVRTFAAAWLRTPEALAELQRHHLTDKISICGCGAYAISHPQHILDELAKAVEGT